MLSFVWLSTALFAVLILQFKASAGQRRAFFIVKVGDEVTLPCAYMWTEKNNCDRITWTSKLPGRKEVTWFKEGIFTEEAKNKSNKLSVTANCSLVVKSVTPVDFGYYFCSWQSTTQKHHLIKVDLSVVTMTKHRTNEEVIFLCSVSIHTYCRHQVVWLYEGKEKISPDQNVSTSCAAAVAVPMSYLHQNSKFYELLKCKVKDGYDRKDRIFTFSDQSSEEKTGYFSFIGRFFCLGVAVPLIIAGAVTTRLIFGYKTKAKRICNGGQPKETVVYENMK